MARRAIDVLENSKECNNGNIEMIHVFTIWNLYTSQNRRLLEEAFVAAHDDNSVRVGDRYAMSLQRYILRTSKSSHVTSVLRLADGHLDTYTYSSSTTLM